MYKVESLTDDDLKVNLKNHNLPVAKRRFTNIQQLLQSRIHSVESVSAPIMKTSSAQTKYMDRPRFAKSITLNQTTETENTHATVVTQASSTKPYKLQLSDKTLLNLGIQNNLTVGKSLYIQGQRYGHTPGNYVYIRTLPSDPQNNPVKLQVYASKYDSYFVFLEKLSNDSNDIPFVTEEYCYIDFEIINTTPTLHKTTVYVTISDKNNTNLTVYYRYNGIDHYTPLVTTDVHTNPLHSDQLTDTRTVVPQSIIYFVSIKNKVFSNRFHTKEGPIGNKGIQKYFGISSTQTPPEFPSEETTLSSIPMTFVFHKDITPPVIPTHLSVPPDTLAADIDAELLQTSNASLFDPADVVEFSQIDTNNMYCTISVTDSVYNHSILYQVPISTSNDSSTSYYIPPRSDEHFTPDEMNRLVLQNGKLPFYFNQSINNYNRYFQTSPTIEMPSYSQETFTLDFDKKFTIDDTGYPIFDPGEIPSNSISNDYVTVSRRGHSVTIEPFKSNTHYITLSDESFIFNYDLHIMFNVNLLDRPISRFGHLHKTGTIVIDSSQLNSFSNSLLVFPKNDSYSSLYSRNFNDQYINPKNVQHIPYSLSKYTVVTYTIFNTKLDIKYNKISIQTIVRN